MRPDARSGGAMSLCVTAVLALSWAQGAAAQPSAKPSVVVRPFAGPSASRARDAVVQGLRKSKRYEIVPNERAESAAARLGADLSTDAGRAAVGRELGLGGFVSGAIEKRGRQFVLELLVHGGATGAQTGQRTFQGRKPGPLLGQVRRRFPAELRRTPLELEQAAVPEPAPPAQLEVTPSEPQAKPDRTGEAADRDQAAAAAREAAEEAEAEAEAEAAEGDGEDAPALEVALGVRLMTRSFSYQEPMTRLPEHSVSPTPAGHVQLRAYPGAPFMRGIAAHLGLELSGLLMLPVEAQDGPSIFETTSKAFGVGLRGRIPLWPSELGIHAGWGAHDIEISDSQFDGDPEVPSVAYNFLRLGADARIALSSELALTVRASYLLLLGYGELAEVRWFPEASGFGIEAQLGAAYALGGPFWAVADLGFTRYSMTLNVEPPPAGSAAMPRVAEGAVDQLFFGTLGAAIRL
jgi:hypothetical protein